MKIIKKGKLPEKRIYKGLCNHCNAEVEALHDELQHGTSPKNEEMHTGPCPFCKTFNISSTINFAQTDQYEDPLSKVPSTPVYRNADPDRLEFGGQSRDTGGHPRLP